MILDTFVDRATALLDWNLTVVVDVCNLRDFDCFLHSLEHRHVTVLVDWSMNVVVDVGDLWHFNCLLDRLNHRHLPVLPYWNGLESLGLTRDTARLCQTGRGSTKLPPKNDVGL